MTKKNRICFVCKQPVSDENAEINKEVLLPECSRCKGTDAEKKRTGEFLDSLADGLVCGCI